jgi:uncharacterized protein YuzE
MAVRQLNQTVNNTSEWLKLANERVNIPGNYVILKYQEDVDLLVIRFNDGKSTYSKDDMDNGIIYNYDRDNNLVSMEILDLYGIYADA